MRILYFRLDILENRLNLFQEFEWPDVRAIRRVAEILIEDPNLLIYRNKDHSHPQLIFGYVRRENLHHA